MGLPVEFILQAAAGEPLYNIRRRNAPVDDGVDAFDDGHLHLMAADELRDYLENGNITHSVNYPDVNVPRSGDTRICVLHKNIPNMLAQISSVVSADGVNIDAMVNKSRKDYAYTVLDVEGNIADAVADDIMKIDGVIRVRVL